MINYDTLIAVTGWEDRFKLGIIRFLDRNSIKKIILFDYSEYSDITRENTNHLMKIFEDKNIECEKYQLKHNNNLLCWKTVKDVINSLEGSLVIDMSTMPRDIIYFSLFHAENSNKINCLYCLYNRPEKYATDQWLTRDPCKPQLVYNMSGISEMGKGSALIIITGFDKKRVEQLLNYYEPQKVFLYLQTGEQYKNNILNTQQYQKSFRSSLIINFLEIDAFSSDYGEKEIEKLIIKERKKSNIIITSLGPKPSSIAIYRLNRKYPDIGLVYVPVTKYNKNYSFGLNETEPVFEQIK